MLAHLHNEAVKNRHHHFEFSLTAEIVTMVYALLNLETTKSVLNIINDQVLSNHPKMMEDTANF